MKKILLVVAMAVSLTSCEYERNWRISKKYPIPYRVPLCTFHYNHEFDWTEFTDTCSKYNVGDTIKH